MLCASDCLPPPFPLLLRQAQEEQGSVQEEASADRADRVSEFVEALRVRTLPVGQGFHAGALARRFAAAVSALTWIRKYHSSVRL